MNRGKAITHIHAAFTQALHFRAHQLDAGFPGIDDFIVKARTTIRRDDESAFGIELIDALLFLLCGSHAARSLADGTIQCVSTSRMRFSWSTNTRLAA